MSKVKPIFTNAISGSVVVGAIGLALCGVISSQAAETENSALDVIQLRPNFYMIAGAGGNIGVQIGSDGVVVVDAGTEAGSSAVLAQIRKLTTLPIRYVINTGADADHVGGNGKLAKSGLTIFINLLGGFDSNTNIKNGLGAQILAHEGVLRRMSASAGNRTTFPSESWPSESFSTDRKVLHINHEGIEVLHQTAAHSDADSFVFFHASDVVVAGDIMDTTQFPVIDLENGGSIQGEIEALNRLAAMTIPATPFIFQDSGTYVIPGHGRVSDHLDTVDYRDMVVIVRDVVADMIKKGMTLEQIKAASPAKPYQTRYGTQAGSTNAFVEAIYKGLASTK